MLIVGYAFGERTVGRSVSKLLSWPRTEAVIKEQSEKFKQVVTNAKSSERRPNILKPCPDDQHSVRGQDALFTLAGPPGRGIWQGKYLVLELECPLNNQSRALMSLPSPHFPTQQFPEAWNSAWWSSLGPD